MTHPALTRSRWAMAPALILVVGCAAPKPTPPAAEPSPSPTTPFLDRCGTEWFGIYIGGLKVGFSRTVTEAVILEGEPVMRRESHLFMETTSGERSVITRSHTLEEFALTPPFGLRYRLEERRPGGAVDGNELRAVPTGFEVKRLGADQPHGVLPGEYGLQDVFSEELWIASSPPPGEIHRHRWLDTDGLAIGISETVVRAVHGSTPGATRPEWELERRAEDGSVETERRTADGRVAAWSLGALELRSESATEAQRGRVAVDTNSIGTAPVDRPLGPPNALQEVILLARGPGVASLASTPAQRLEPLGTELARVRLQRMDWRDRPTAPFTEPNGPHTRPTLRFPAGDPQIRELAQKVIDPGATAEIQVATLCKFVADYIADDAIACDHATVADVIRERRGDCSDHALLFICLARAAGIPARPVTGLLYFGDDAMEFGPHDWCEVGLEGRWVPVDPAWNEFPASPWRLRLGANELHGVIAARLALELESVSPREEPPSAESRRENL